MPYGIDISQDHLYVIDNNHIYILTLEKNLVVSWPLPQPKTWSSIKVDGENIYASVDDQILLYNRKGILQKTFIEKKNRFNPRGIAVDGTLLYVCDRENHCIVVLDKYGGEYQTEWGTFGRLEGQFEYPWSIYLWEEILCVGDKNSIQLFTGGRCRERIETWEGERFSSITGLCVLKNHLYVSDWRSNRIRVFRLDHE